MRVQTAAVARARVFKIASMLMVRQILWSFVGDPRSRCRLQMMSVEQARARDEEFAAKERALLAKSPARPAPARPRPATVLGFG